MRLFVNLFYLTWTGYGHQTPLSAGGKSFCIIFALIGIPMTLLLLTAVVDRLLIPIGLFLRFINAKLGHLYSQLSIRLIHLSTVNKFKRFYYLTQRSAAKPNAGGHLFAHQGFFQLKFNWKYHASCQSVFSKELFPPPANIVPVREM